MAELSLALRDEVLPALGSHEGREHVGTATGGSGGGDVTFAPDERAESFLERFLAERAPDVAFYSEDRGMVAPGGEPDWVLIVDPIDGPRLGVLRHDPDRDGTARRLRRARAEDVADVPGMRQDFERVGAGAVLNNSPYDLAAAVLCLVEAGAVVTDAYGRGLEGRPLLGSHAEFQISCVAAAIRDLHAAILESIEDGIDRLAGQVA